jgi:hypothetical protein
VKLVGLIKLLAYINEKFSEECIGQYLLEKLPAENGPKQGEDLRHTFSTSLFIL